MCTRVLYSIQQNPHTHTLARTPATVAHKMCYRSDSYCVMLGRISSFHRCRADNNFSSIVVCASHDKLLLPLGLGWMDTNEFVCACVCEENFHLNNMQNKAHESATIAGNTGTRWWHNRNDTKKSMADFSRSVCVCVWARANGITTSHTIPHSLSLYMLCLRIFRCLLTGWLMLSIRAFSIAIIFIFLFVRIIYNSFIAELHLCSCLYGITYDTSRWKDSEKEIKRAGGVPKR